MDNGFKEIFNELKAAKAISNAWEYVLIMLAQEYHVSDDIMKLFCVFFSLIDDGNICISLDENELKRKWHEKLAGLDAATISTDYDTVISRGILAISQYPADNPLVFRYDAPGIERKNNMFVIYRGWLFTEKFFNAKQIVEESVNLLFSENANTSPEHGDEDAAVASIKSKYDYTDNNSGRKFELAPEQARAIVRAKNGRNLIVTGGPGTGKTTVICYLLLEMLAKNGGCSIYMAAPSGKAAKRMRESIAGVLNGLKDEIKSTHREEIDILSDVEPITIHRLLGLSGFNTHETKKFPSDSVFVIDEASMIDVVLFAKLLNTITQSHETQCPRIFILGDKDQLPSVQPGAVFCDLTQKYRGRDCLIELTKSQRFREKSEIFNLKEHIRHGEPVAVDWCDFDCSTWQEELKTNQKNLKRGIKEYPVKYLTISDEDAIDCAPREWYAAFYDAPEYQRVYSDLDLQSGDILRVLDGIWSHLETAKILCAENHGARGTDNINKTICQYVKSTHQLESDTDFFVGQQIIITKNQNLYDLSNGDIGVVVSIKGTKYIMIKRVKENSDASDGAVQNLILQMGNYIFYPLYLLPTDAIDSAYAITIHKSQGSEYNNILVILPESENSPLLNRQILYTAITRTKNATYIISSQDNMNRAIEKPAMRDTQLFL
ncbi:MAG: AAA family ATPase [Alphaproteobacteria bacterium]|nr:AAA family ATPase [Alphaproteobacteria bacterium]